jgi:hypothetical protein
MSGIFINSDAWNFWLAKPDAMSAAGIRKDVDFYAERGGVEAVFYNMNFQRAVFDSKVFTPIWKDCEFDAAGDLLLRGKKTDSSYRDLVVNPQLLRQNVPDFMQVRYDHCHARGIEMWHSMRMNDVHYTPMQTEHLPLHGDLWVERKDLIRAWYRHTWRGDWHDNAFDYGKQEVYDYHLALIREYLLDFESDGIELDWLRSIPVFRPGFDELNKGILTRFMRDTRKLADAAGEKWGHRIRIAVRVPYRPEDAIATGMDVFAWARERLVDIVIPGPNNTSSENDVPVDLWKMLLPQEVVLAPCIDCTLRASPGGPSLSMTAETDHGFAATYYYGGADTLYFYNHFPRNRFDGVQELFGYAGRRGEVERRARRHVVTHHDDMAEGKFSYPRFPPIIWKGCCNGSIRVNAGGATAGRSARVVVGAKSPLEIDLLLNTSPCKPLSDAVPMPPLALDGVHYLQFGVPGGTLHDGINAIELFNRSRERDITDLVWAEIDIDQA